MSLASPGVGDSPDQFFDMQVTVTRLRNTTFAMIVTLRERLEQYRAGCNAKGES